MFLRALKAQTEDSLKGSWVGRVGFGSLWLILSYLSFPNRACSENLREECVSRKDRLMTGCSLRHLGSLSSSGTAAAQGGSCRAVGSHLS